MLNQVTDLKGPDGTTTIHRSTNTHQDMQELKKRYSVEAKKNFKDFLKIQKRSKMIASK